jgi:hypothetical protein
LHFYQCNKSGKMLKESVLFFSRGAVCAGRYKRKSDKQRIAEVFQVEVGLDDLPYEEGDDLRPQSMQPVISINEAGERQMELMRWAFKLPDRLLFNARSEGIERSRFWGGCLSEPPCHCSRRCCLRVAEHRRKEEAEVGVHHPRTGTLWHGCCLETVAEPDARRSTCARIFPADKMRAQIVGETPMTTSQFGLFDSQ